MRIIDADALLSNFTSGALLFQPDVRAIIEHQQTIDAVPVVRCGDCRYKDDGIDEDGIPFLKCLNGRSYGGTRINDFCSWAERRTDETD